MRAVMFAAALLVPGCTLYFDEEPEPDPPLPTYQLVPRGNIAAFGNIVGVAWDGRQHWLVTHEEVGDYTVADRVSVFAFDVETGVRSNEIVLANHADRPMGATWIQGELWIHYTLTGNIVSLDPATGVETPRFSVGWATYEIDSDDTSLFVADSSVGGTVEVRDLATGEITDELWTPEWHESLRGIAVVKPSGASAYEVWGGSLATNSIPVMGGDEVGARATFDGFANNMNAQFVFAGQRLTMLMNNQLYFFDVLR